MGAIGSQPPPLVASQTEARELDGLIRSPSDVSSSQAPEGSRQTDAAELNVSDEAREQLRTRGVSDLSPEELEQIREMKLRDREVRTHEQAHKNVGGRYTGAIHLDYDQGPDGRNYAVSGHVSIDVAPVEGDPQATIEKMSVVARAALAPAQPSSADRAVAAQANATAAAARGELLSSRVLPEVEASDAEPSLSIVA